MQNLKKTIAPEMNSGFTLLELILASLITTIVVTITGIGLLNLSSSDIRNAAEKELLNNFNRASAFLSDELRQARRVLSEDDLKPSNDVANGIPNGAIPSDATRVLGIINPNFTTPIVYYTLASPAKLIGPRVLYRYGPDFNADVNIPGTYKTPSNTTTWVTAVMTDLIPNANDTAVLASLRRSCPSGSGWTRIPSDDTKIDGFSACVNGTNRVNLRLYGTFPLAITGTPRISHETSTTVFTRSAPSTPTPTPTPSPTPSPSPS